MQLLDALAARIEAVPFPGAAEAGLHCDEHRPAPDSALAADAKAIIHCPARSVTSSGRRGAAEWVLEFEPRSKPFIDPLMGWSRGADTLTQVRLRFPTKRAAIDYARRQGLHYEVCEPAHIRGGDLVRARRQTPAIDHAVPIEIAWAWDAPHLAIDRLAVANLCPKQAV